MPQTIRIVRGFGSYEKGQLVTIGGGVASVWIRMGRAVPYVVPKIETATLQTLVETADRTPRRRRTT